MTKTGRYAPEPALSAETTDKVARLEHDGDLEGAAYEYGFEARTQEWPRNPAKPRAWPAGWDDAEALGDEPEDEEDQPT